MSLVMTVYMREGIVMAADSRLTLNIPRVQGETNQLLSITSSDSAKKLFLAPNNVGIATCGVADIGGVPVAGFVESFIVEKLKENLRDAIEVSNELKSYFQALSVRPGTIFQVAGYITGTSGLEQAVFQIDPAIDAAPVRLNIPTQQGASWNGEIDVLQRLYNDVLLVQENGQPPVPMPSFGVPFQFFTLQDAIDFAVSGIKSTIETLRFQQREKTVGGAIDVLIIQPDSSEWVAQKSISVPD